MLGQTLTPELGASAHLDYGVGPATFAIEGNTHSSGAHKARANVGIQHGIAKVSAFAAQNFGTQNLQTTGARLDLNAGNVSTYVSGELQSQRAHLKTGISLKWDRLKMGTEAALQETQHFHLKQSVGYEHKGLSVNASVNPLSFSNTPDYQVGIGFKATF